MRRVMKIMCIICACLCLIRGLFGVVDPESGFDIVPKLERFTQAEVFDFNSEVVTLQLMRYSFDGIVGMISAPEGGQYYEYLIRRGTGAGPGGAIRIYDTQGNVGAYVTSIVRTKGDSAWYEVVGNFCNSVVEVLRLAGEFLIDSILSIFDVVAEVVKLFLDIIFDVST